MLTLCRSLFAILRFPHFSAPYITRNKQTELNKQQIMSQGQFVVLNIYRKMAIQAIQSHSRSRILGSVEGDKGLNNTI